MLLRPIYDIVRFRYILIYYQGNLSSYLDLKATLVFLDDLLLKFGACAGLLLGHVKSALGLSLLLLVADHLLNARRLELLLLFLHVDQFCLFTLFHFDPLCLLELLFEELLLGHLDGLLDVVLHVLVPL